MILNKEARASGTLREASDNCVAGACSTPTRSVLSGMLLRVFRYIKCGVVLVSTASCTHLNKRFHREIDRRVHRPVAGSRAGT